mmetsp:Transcript_17678/g.35619  ORF Transcript_17678/g.35619 Transcript_17678/m.35619 type:complete len:347 (-) Transcript_17678:418-1458(-)
MEFTRHPPNSKGYMSSLALDVPSIRDDEGIRLRSCCTGTHAGHVLRTLKRLPNGPPKAMVIFVHGTFQHSRAVELQDLQQLILQRGIGWFGMDAPGHGMSGQLGDPEHSLAPAFVPDVDAYIHDLYFFIETVTSDARFASLPVILMGHSWGTSCMTYLLPRLQDFLGDRLKGVCYSACTCLPHDMPDPRMPSSCSEWAVLYANAYLTPEKKPVSGKQNLGLKAVARDLKMRELCGNDKLRYLGGERPYWTSLAWTLGNIYKRAGYEVSKVKVPLCIHTGSADKAVSPLCGPNMYCASATPTSNKTIKILPDSTHNLFADPHRGIMIDEWCQFVDKALSGGFEIAAV